MNLSLENPNVLLMLIVATLGILSWRYLGVVLYKKIEPDSSLAKFVNAIAYGMTTAIVFKMIIFPNSAIKLIPLFERVIPFFLGVVVYFYISIQRNTSVERQRYDKISTVVMDLWNISKNEFNLITTRFEAWGDDASTSFQIVRCKRCR